VLLSKASLYSAQPNTSLATNRKVAIIIGFMAGLIFVLAIVVLALYLMRRKTRQKRDIWKSALHPAQGLHKTGSRGQRLKGESFISPSTEVSNPPSDQSPLARRLGGLPSLMKTPDAQQCHSYPRRLSIHSFASSKSRWSYHGQHIRPMDRAYQGHVASDGDSVGSLSTTQANASKTALKHHSSMQPGYRPHKASAASVYTLGTGTSNYDPNDPNLSHAPITSSASANLRPSYHDGASESFTHTESSISRIRFTPLTERQMDLQDRLFDVQKQVIDLHTVDIMSPHEKDPRIRRLRDDIERLTELMKSDWAQGLTDKRPAQLREDDLPMRF
jgi:hypothetical protein